VLLSLKVTALKGLAKVRVLVRDVATGRRRSGRGEYGAQNGVGNCSCGRGCALDGGTCERTEACDSGGANRRNECGYATADAIDNTTGAGERDRHGQKGEPVSGLSKQDFVVLDEGKTQEIAFFSAEAPAPTGITMPKLPANAFTNRFDLKGQDPGAVTVVLFDSLNTSVQDQGWVRNQVIKFLNSLQPQDHVAVYALTNELLILHEFTQDASALVEAANQFKPKETALYDGSNPAYFNVPALAADPAWARFQEAVNQTDARIADQYKMRRAEMTANALRVIANHVSTIPGRKNLVWVTGSFPFSIVVERLGAPERQNETAGPYGYAAAQALNRVNMAVYPVDATGMVPSAGLDPSRGGDSLSDPHAIQYCADCISQAPGNSPGMLPERISSLRNG
jgi:VWFA-related protein